MRIDFSALHQRTFLGGIGGLLGWGLMALFLGAADTGSFFQAALKGALIGLALGAAVGAWDGLFRDRSRQRLLRGMRVGACVGLAAGLIGLPVGDFIFGIGQNLLARAVGWAVFGALVGINEGIAKGMRQKTLFGVFGGLLGGLLGGSTYESLAEFFQAIGVSRATAGALGSSLGLVLLGMFIGLMISLVEDLMRAAWLLFTSGRFEGQTRTLDLTKEVTTLGRHELADICILGDAALASHHAQIVRNGGQFVLEAVEGEVLVSPGGNGEFVRVTRHPLANGDMFQIGGQRARFQEGNVKA